MILHYRVDERVVHGQTTTRITKEFACNGIIIVDDEICNDTFMLQLFKKTVPEEMRVIGFSTERAPVKLKEAEESKKNYIVIFKKPKAARILAENGYHFGSTLYIGPQNLKEDGTFIMKMIGLNPQEMADLDCLESKGVRVILNPQFDTPDLTWKQAKEKIKKQG